MPAPPVASAGVGGGGVEQDKKVALVVFWEGDDLFDSVNRPAEDDLLRTPGGVAFAELFEQDWLLSCSVVLSFLAEEFVDGAEKVSRHLISFVQTSLYYTNEFIKVYFGVS